MAALENNLIIDLEDGYKGLSALVVQARNINDFGDICRALQEEIKNNDGKYPYKYITIDNATRLEEMCMGYAITLYRQTPMGKIIKVQTSEPYQTVQDTCTFVKQLKSN